MPCCVCGHRIRAGIVHHKDQGNPPRSAMCLRDYNELMADPETWKEAHRSEQL